MQNYLVKQFLKLQIPRLSNHYSQPEIIQFKQLNYLLKTASYTDFGIRHGFNKIKSYADFCNSVPLQNYETLKPYIQRTMNGERNVIWPTNISWFAKTSGSAEDKSKFIPVSREALTGCHYRGGIEAMATYYHRNPDSKLFEGKSLILGGSHTIGELNPNVRFGDLSAVLIQNVYPFANYFRVPEKKIALMDNWDLKIDKIIEATSHVNVTNISGVPSWMLVLIKKMLEKKQTDNLLHIWPNLKLFIHGAVNFEPYREQFKKFIPSEEMSYIETYNASEGFFAMQDDPNSDDMLLMLDYGIFYEFIPVDQINESQKAIPLEEVKPGINYAMIISTNSGLWRYLIGDTVKFTSTKPYKIKISGRTKHFINAFGEELVIENAEKAVTKACLATNAEIRDFTAAPVFMSDKNTGAHEWLIEFEKQPSNPETFARVLDESLKQLNSDYEAKRKGNYILRFPKIRILPLGTFEKWLKSKNKLGGQHKVPRLSNERKYVEEILKVSGAEPEMI